MPACEGRLWQKPTEHWGKGKPLSFWGGLAEGKPRARGLSWSLPTGEHPCKERQTRGAYVGPWVMRARMWLMSTV